MLERLLNEASSGVRFEVLNLGVGGYSSRDEALLLRHKGMEWNPDPVIMGYFLNDPEIEPVQPLHSQFQEPSWWQHSNLLRLIARAKNLWDDQKTGRWGLLSLSALAATARNGRASSRPSTTSRE